MAGNLDLEILEQRIAKAKADCVTWRAAGNEEKYLESCCVLEALELQRAIVPQRPSGPSQAGAEVPKI